MNKLYEVYRTPNLEIRALQVPGGLIFITDNYQESDNGIAAGVTSVFVPMSRDEMMAFLKGRE